MVNRRAQSADRRHSRGGPCAFTLLESLVAITLLGTIMVAVVAALSASQKVALEGQKRILAAIACDDMMSELATLSYDDLRARDGTLEPVGQMRTLDGAPYPDSFWTIGRTTSVEPMTMTDEDSGLSVAGVLVTVAGVDEAVTLIEVQLFVADPSVTGEESDLEGGDIEGGGTLGGGGLGGGGGTLGGHGGSL